MHDGLAAWFSGHGSAGVARFGPATAKIERRSDEIEVLLAEGADAQTLLKRLIDSGVTVSKFELIEPSLNDIFIAKVGENE